MFLPVWSRYLFVVVSFQILQPVASQGYAGTLFYDDRSNFNALDESTPVWGSQAKPAEKFQPTVTSDQRGYSNVRDAYWQYYSDCERWGVLFDQKANSMKQTTRLFLSNLVSTDATARMTANIFRSASHHRLVKSEPSTSILGELANGMSRVGREWKRQQYFLAKRFEQYVVTSVKYLEYWEIETRRYELTADHRRCYFELSSVCRTVVDSSPGSCVQSTIDSISKRIEAEWQELAKVFRLIRIMAADIR